MEWQRTHGSKAEWLAKRGKPEWLNRPRLHPGLDEVARCFAELDVSRDGIGPVDVLAWCELHGIDEPDRRARFWRLVHAMDVRLRLLLMKDAHADPGSSDQRGES